ncbi:MAG: hypothetical protein A4E38_01960 [Methanoregulaceae archaeon PtaB.Bin108]|nr:MAG: hypothetical protein A4E38_01960 [Methanoregulaceae archaeon PtaB.Bin108]
MTILPILIGIIIIISLIVGPVYAETKEQHGGSYYMRDGRDPTGETEYHWYWYEDEHEMELHQYYRIVHTLTGWNIPLLEYLEVVSPEDLATMPPGMYELFNMGHTPLFHEGFGTSSSNSTWWDAHPLHIWISPEGEAYNGDLPPYQWLVWNGWEEYADHLPAPPEGAPFPAPEYKGTPRNTLPFARMDIRGFYNIDYEIENPCPDAIIDPIDLSDWDWTPEMKEHLANLGLDPDMSKTRLGYEKSGITITMVGMTPSGVMKEWTLTLSKGGWTCDSASAEELENILFILKRIDAISDNSVAAPAPAVTEKRSLSSLKDLVSNTLNARIQPEFTTNPASLLAAKGLTLNEMEMNAVKGVNSSAIRKSSIVSGQSVTASISDRRELLSRTGAITERKSPLSIKAAGAFQKGSQARARG